MSKDFDEKNKCKSSELACELKKVDTIAFHMPGHKRQEFDHLFGVEKLDYTEIEGTDNLHDAKGILKNAMEHAADVFSARATRFLVNGSTCGILAGIRAASKRGDAILVARNCHKSVYNAIELLGLVPEYILPEYLEDVGFYGGVEPSKVESLLKKTGAKLVVLTSPTYEGVISNIKAIADVCHKNDAILFVDEAHGAHLGFDGFEESARTLGADIVVNSLHKTLPSLTQTALLHVCSDRVDMKRIDESLAMFETSSPSYVLMSSIDGCVRCVENGRENWSKSVDKLRASFEDLEHIRLFDGNDSFAYDKSKLVFLLGGCSLSG
ncbi:MAG: aminotransferase class V-fold PLP-dependent enzyme, partial [Clostridia bacterium]|nr:aminotransferase class V-fold PLP-dependent enzyme [Clostridia bacterium]